MSTETLLCPSPTYALSRGFILEQASQEDHRLLTPFPQTLSHRTRVSLQEIGVPTPQLQYNGTRVVLRKKADYKIQIIQNMLQHECNLKAW